MFICISQEILVHMVMRNNSSLRAAELRTSMDVVDKVRMEHEWLAAISIACSIVCVINYKELNPELYSFSGLPNCCYVQSRTQTLLDRF